MRNQNLDAFEKRMKRIAKNEGGQRNMLAGEGDVKSTRFTAEDLRRATKPKKSAGPKTTFKDLPKAVIGFGIGLLAMLVARLAGFHVIASYVFGDALTSLLMLRGAEIALAIVVMFILGMILKINSGLGKMAMTAGMALMLIGEPEVARYAPSIWQEMFSPQYAAGVLAPQAGIENNLRSIADVVLARL
ncbi:hypothetical protein KO498_10905 [Lentibacter algarum]|uniref:hypothetical protein n=1 Tax=Lentibacter algarum TaxID=576131 RepID=UPI001C0735BF|nr:hypothetical protein [Lentibacter algarum]MBU2982316.1 hypothetical protein [Lentibacter algarum]